MFYFFILKIGQKGLAKTLTKVLKKVKPFKVKLYLTIIRL